MSGFFLQLIFLLSFPLVVACGSAYVSWGALSKPWVYLVLCAVVLYAFYAALFYLVGPKSVGYAVSAVRPGDTPQDVPPLMLLRPYSIPLIGFVLACVPVVLLLLKAFRR